MPRDVAGSIGDGHAVRFEHTDDGDGRRHQRRLGVFGEAQGILGAFEHDFRERDAERIIDFLEDSAGRGIGLGKIVPHADSLAALSGKGEGRFGHEVLSRIFCSGGNLGGVGVQ